jgi:hypothetical protein
MRNENMGEVKTLIAELKKSRSPITKEKAARLEELLNPIFNGPEEIESKWSWDGKDPLQLARQAKRILYKAPYYLEEAEKQIRILEEEENDIDHALELITTLTQEQRIELLERLTTILRERRKIKRFVELMEPFGNFAYRNKSFVRELKEVVNKMIEKTEVFEKRTYTPRRAQYLEQAFKEIAPTKEEK